MYVTVFVLLEGRLSGVIPRKSPNEIRKKWDSIWQVYTPVYPTARRHRSEAHRSNGSLQVDKQKVYQITGSVESLLSHSLDHNCFSFVFKCLNIAILNIDVMSVYSVTQQHSVDVEYIWCYFAFEGFWSLTFNPKSSTQRYYFYIKL